MRKQRNVLSKKDRQESLEGRTAPRALGRIRRSLDVGNAVTTDHVIAGQHEGSHVGKSVRIGNKVSCRAAEVVVANLTRRLTSGPLGVLIGVMRVHAVVGRHKGTRARDGTTHIVSNLASRSRRGTAVCPEDNRPNTTVMVTDADDDVFSEASNDVVDGFKTSIRAAAPRTRRITEIMRSARVATTKLGIEVPKGSKAIANGHPARDANTVAGLLLKDRGIVELDVDVRKVLAVVGDELENLRLQRVNEILSSMDCAWAHPDIRRNDKVENTCAVHDVEVLRCNTT